jgi:hypothetical protein
MLKKAIKNSGVGSKIGCFSPLKSFLFVDLKLTYKPPLVITLADKV